MVKRSENSGALCGYIDGYKCPRCCKNFGYLHPSPTGIMFFCGEGECLQDDSESSKSLVGDKMIISQPKDAALNFGMGAKYVNACLPKWTATKQHMDLVLKWSKDPKNMLVLIGPPETGKTYFCAAIANYFIEKGRLVKYFNSRRYFEEIQKAIQSDKSQYEAVRNIAQSDILILDDLGASTNSEWQKEVILDLIDQRYSSEKPTIITSNLDENNAKIALGERTTRRIFSENLVLTVGDEYVRRR